MQKQYVQRFPRSELDKLDKSASVSQSCSSCEQMFMSTPYRYSRSCFSQLPPNFLVELGLKGSPTVSDTYVVHPGLILEYAFPSLSLSVARMLPALFD